MSNWLTVDGDYSLFYRDIQVYSRGYIDKNQDIYTPRCRSIKLVIHNFYQNLMQ